MHMSGTHKLTHTHTQNSILVELYSLKEKRSLVMKRLVHLTLLPLAAAYCVRAHSHSAVHSRRLGVASSTRALAAPTLQLGETEADEYGRSKNTRKIIDGWLATRGVMLA